MDLRNDRPFLESLAKGISAQFGPNCEVVVHDFSNSYDNTILIIENGHVSGRHVGDCASLVALEALKSDSELQDHSNYLMRTKDGRVLKSTTIYLHDSNQKVIGIFAINFDVTDLIVANNTIKTFINVAEEEQTDVIPSNVNDLLDTLIEQSYQSIGKPVAVMTKDDKIRAIKYLEKKGALLIKKAGDKIAKFYDISKYTLYNYLDADDIGADGID